MAAATEKDSKHGQEALKRKPSRGENPENAQQCRPKKLPRTDAKAESGDKAASVSAGAEAEKPAIHGTGSVGECFRETSIDDIASVVRAARSVVVLTGAGVSLASGIPTYRGSEGFWTIGSHNYTPQAIATNRMFRDRPRECWKYFVERHLQCKAAKPNEAHKAIAGLEKLVQAGGGTFTLISQNVDGLHLRAGSKPLEIHGSLSFVRCLNDECDGANMLFPFPCSADLEGKDPKLVMCTRCKTFPVRPSVLFFDECYDEDIYKADSAHRAVDNADLLIVAGTQGCTNLPSALIAIAAQNEIDVVDIDPNLSDPILDHFHHQRPLMWVNDKAEVAFPRLNEVLERATDPGAQRTPSKTSRRPKPGCGF